MKNKLDQYTFYMVGDEFHINGLCMTSLFIYITKNHVKDTYENE